jgi:hypothetical protein
LEVLLLLLLLLLRLLLQLLLILQCAATPLHGRPQRAQKLGRL